MPASVDVPPEDAGAHHAIPGARRGLRRVVVIVFLVVALFVCVRATGLGERFADLRTWVAELGPWGPMGFVALYVVATLLAIPGTALGVLAGPLFGTSLGTLCVSLGSTIGAALCFLVARYFVGSAFREGLRRNERFHRLDELTRREGWIVVAITRLVPLFPFNLLNYGFGLTSVPFWTYVGWSWLCMLPGTVLYVSGADVATQVASGDVRPVTWIVLGLAIAILASLGRAARRRLRAAGD
ncbi:MAG: TVP38/TMEM64 family protein [Planctomycetes bacterium]|nr:TVP38/TMEM64 family protein [Planctomycetota bacterium]MCB9891914.1 TVP38/TMEM64 family protein [Planctomycetota bacterium]